MISGHTHMYISSLYTAWFTDNITILTSTNIYFLYCEMHKRIRSLFIYLHTCECLWLWLCMCTVYYLLYWYNSKKSTVLTDSRAPGLSVNTFENIGTKTFASLTHTCGACTICFDSYSTMCTTIYVCVAVHSEVLNACN